MTFSKARLAALAVPLTAAAAWLYAHEGHEPLPTRGVKADPARGLITLSPEAHAALGVETAEVTAESLDERLTVPVTLVAPWQRQAVVTTRLAGRVTAVHAVAGQAVARGAALAEVQSLELENLQQELLSAQNEARLSGQNLAQLEAAGRSGAVAEKDLFEAVARNRQDRNDLEIARLKLRGLGVEEATLTKLLADPSARPLRTLPVTSPFAGTVTHSDLRVGQVVDLADHLFEVVDLSTLWVRAEVLEQDLARVAPGETVEVRLAAYPGETFRAAVKLKGLSLDPVTGQGTVWAELSNPAGQPSRLLPGMYGQADIVLTDFPPQGAKRRVEEGGEVSEGSTPHPNPPPQGGRGKEKRPLEETRPDSLLWPPPPLGGRVGVGGRAADNAGKLAQARKVLIVPDAALVSDGAERYVLREDAPGQFSRQNIVVGRQARGRVEVRAGALVPGDRVVTLGSHELATFFATGVLRLSAEAEKNIGLRVEPVRQQTVANVVQISGAVDLPPGRRAVATSRLAGVVRRLLVDRDQNVKAGDVLAEVASVEFQALQLDLLRSQLQLKLLEQTLQRLRPMAGGPAFSARALREAESGHVAALQRREGLRRKLEAVGLTAGQVQGLLDKQQFVDALPIRSPLDGVVVRFHAGLGHAVKAEDPVFDLHSLARPVVRGFVSERELPAVRVGQPARVRLASAPGASADAVVVRSGQSFGAEDRTLSVWVELKETPRPPWLHGMTARLTLLASEPAATPAVPLGAVHREGARAFVFVRRPDGVFDRREVTLGRADDRHVAVTGGLEEGEMIAVRGAADLQTAYAGLR